MAKSDAAQAAARHWAPVVVKRAIGHKENPIVIDDTEPLSKRQRTQLCKPNKLLLLNCASCTNQENKNTVRFSSLIGTAQLKKTYQFNFSVDVDLFKSLLHPNFLKEKRPVIFVTGSELITPEHTASYNFSHVLAKLPIRFGTHHTKMMINFYSDDTCEIIIMTCNITKIDFGGLTQMLWRSGRLNTSGTTDGTKSKRFKRDLIKYILKYKSQVLNELVADLEKYDFAPCDVELVVSVPGKYKLSSIKDDSEIYGYGKLYQVLKRNGCLIQNNAQRHNFLAQVTSMASPLSIPGNTERGNIFSHILCPLFFTNNPLTVPGMKGIQPGAQSMVEHQKEYNYKAHIVFPTLNEILTNNLGILAGQAVHFNQNGSSSFGSYLTQVLRPLLCKWKCSEDLTGRENTPPHTKIYMCDNADDFKTLKWLYMGSHNLSKQAWGAGEVLNAQLSPLSYAVASYEMGVVVTNPEHVLLPVYEEDERPNTIRLPFIVPPAAYDETDQPWSTALALR